MPYEKAVSNLLLSIYHSTFSMGLLKVDYRDITKDRDMSTLNMLLPFSLNFGFTTFINILLCPVKNPLGQNWW